MLNVHMTSRSKVSPKGIADLRKKRKEAIEKLDFESAEQITKHMERGRDRDLDSIAAQMETNFKKELNDCLISYNRDIEEYEKSLKNRIMVIRLKYHRSFTALKKGHLEQLAEIEANYSDSVVKERDKMIPEQLHLLNQAKKAAANGDFQDAIALRNESRITSQTDLEKRIQQLDHSFKDLRSKTLNQQRTEIIQMTTRLEDELTAIEGERRNKLEAMYERHFIYVRGVFEKTCSKLIKEGYPSVRTRKLFDNDLVRICAEHNFSCPSLFTPERKS